MGQRERKRKKEREREKGRASSSFHGPKMMNQFSNVCWQFLTTADWAGSFWKASAITANTPLDAHKKSWQHLSVRWHSRELRAPHLLPLVSNTKGARIRTVFLLALIKAFIHRRTKNKLCCQMLLWYDQICFTVVKSWRKKTHYCVESH